MDTFVAFFSFFSGKGLISTSFFESCSGGKHGKLLLVVHVKIHYSLLSNMLVVVLIAPIKLHSFQK
jgi:hypothetical protein